MINIITIMQLEGHIAHLLGRFDLRKFTTKESRRVQDFERHSSASHRNARSIQLTIALSFECNVLVTSIEIQGRQGYGQWWEVGEIEASSSSSRGNFGPAVSCLHLNTHSRADSTSLTAISVTQNLRLTLVLQRPYPQALCDVLALKKERSKATTDQNAAKILEHCIRGVRACGYHLGSTTSAEQLVPLLNISQTFKQHKRLDEAAQSDILAAMSLISARRFVQAAELLRKVSRFYVQKYVCNKSSMELTRIDRSWVREPSAEPSDFSVLTRSFAAGRVLEGGRYLYKAAKVQLLLADTINQPSLLGEKLEALNRACSFANGNVNSEPILTRIDYEQTVYSIAPSIMPFLLKVLGESSQILKVSALKTIQFFYQTLGCTLGTLMPQLVTTLCQLYPRMKEVDRRQEEGGVTSRSKLVLDHINHLLETLLGLVSSMNKRHLKVLFGQVVGIRGQDCRNQLRLYLLRFSEKILQLCGADIEVSLPYLKYVLVVGQGRLGGGSESVSKHINHNIVFFAQRILDLLKTRILVYSQKTVSIGAICSWMHESLIQICDNDTAFSLSRLSFILDLVIGIYSRNRTSLASPVEPIIYLLNASLAQSKLPFQKILETLVVLLKRAQSQPESQGLAGQMVDRILAGAKQCTLGQGEFRVLEGVLSAVGEVRVEWLSEFLPCIPHSNHDQVYAIFDRLISGCAKLIDQPLLQRIILTLFDQYTVKGKAHQHSKDHLIQALLRRQPKALSLLLSICLVNNIQPKPSNYHSIRKNSSKGHFFDSKLFKLHSELFLQKLGLAFIVVSESEQLRGQLGPFFREEGIGSIETAIKRGFSSTSFKVKYKMLGIARSLLWAVEGLGSQWQKERILFGRMMIEIMRSFISEYRDSKLHYTSVLNLGLALQLIPNVREKVNGATLCEIRANQLFKVLPSLMAMLQSPWENIRQITTIALLNVFREGLGQPTQPHMSKLKQILKQLILRCMASQEYAERLMGIRLLALLLGLGREWGDHRELLRSIQTGWGYFKQFLNSSLKLEDDWHQEISATSQMVNGVVVSHELRSKMGQRCLSDRKNNTLIFQNSLFSLPPQEELQLDNPQPHCDTLEHILRADEDFGLQDSFQPPEITPALESALAAFRDTIGLKHYKNINTCPERDSALEEDYLDPTDEQHAQQEQQLSRSQEPLEIEDVGIVDLDDQEWGEEEVDISEQQQAQVLITQKLPLKKVYKLSPNLGTGSKHPRRRNKPYNPAEFERDRIIVDEVDGKIVLPSLPDPTRQSLPLPELSQPESSLFKVEKQQKVEADAVDNIHFEEISEKRFLSNLVESDLVEPFQPKQAPRKQKKGGSRKRKTSSFK